MKKILALSVLALGTAASAGMKFGVVDMMTLVRSHSQYESDRTLLVETEKDYQKKLEKMRTELDALQTEGRKVAEQAKNPMLSQSAKDKIEKDMIDIQNRFLAGQQKIRSEAMRSQQDLQELEARCLKRTTEDIRKTLAGFAEKNGYDMIVDSAAAHFAKKSLDVTDMVLKEMGVERKDGKEKNESK
jgi:Skp family chaperone for outer membrane proteins